MVAEVSTASGQQTQGVDQIPVTVEQLDSVAQQNAANSGERAATAEDLSSQAAPPKTLKLGAAVLSHASDAERADGTSPSRVRSNPGCAATP